MRKDPISPPGQIHRLRIDSTVLKGNLLGDPSERIVDVYVPAKHDGKGLPPGLEWPQPGKLSALIVRSLRENAKAGFAVDSVPGRGMRITITFERATLTASKGTQTSLGPEEGR